MANGHGGYRRPEHPAPVSGPGKYSKRTDGGPAQVMSAAPDQGYGEAKQQMDAQRIAPMGAAAPMPPAAPLPQGGDPSAGGGTAGPVADFGGPSTRPDEPITHGVDIGPGAGSEVMPLAPVSRPDGYLTNLLGALSPSDMTGTLGQLYQIAKQRGV